MIFFHEVVPTSKPQFSRRLLGLQTPLYTVARGLTTNAMLSQTSTERMINTTKPPHGGSLNKGGSRFHQLTPSRYQIKSDSIALFQAGLFSACVCLDNQAASIDREDL
jgi:hypothetical protein